MRISGLGGNRRRPIPLFIHLTIPQLQQQPSFKMESLELIDQGLARHLNHSHYETIGPVVEYFSHYNLTHLTILEGVDFGHGPGFAHGVDYLGDEIRQYPGLKSVTELTFKPARQTHEEDNAVSCGFCFMDFELLTYFPKLKRLNLNLEFYAFDRIANEYNYFWSFPVFETFSWEVLTHIDIGERTEVDAAVFCRLDYYFPQLEVAKFQNMILDFRSASTAKCFREVLHQDGQYRTHQAVRYLPVLRDLRISIKIHMVR
ncbi:Protein of unknown function [Pyronema omphalodes CBS 100304]|uniref:Uncharacterized protein n=1 Tax=Pyronema omphalodes (strain CBS 100304) TaxID=1076935 RepID=U4LKC8_PYROM|nr:Protein of unknown function [Pyronema omphalodes CBS 100304]